MISQLFVLYKPPSLSQDPLSSSLTPEMDPREVFMRAALKSVHINMSISRDFATWQKQKLYYHISKLQDLCHSNNESVFQSFDTRYACPVPKRLISKWCMILDSGSACSNKNTLMWCESQCAVIKDDVMCACVMITVQWNLNIPTLRMSWLAICILPVGMTSC